MERKEEPEVRGLREERGTHSVIFAKLIKGFPHVAQSAYVPKYCRLNKPRV